MRIDGNMPASMLMHCDDETPEEELKHWGVLGMKWGVRRYQNKDGSLTAAGRKKLKKESDALKEEERTLKKRKATQAKIDKLNAKKKELDEQKRELDGNGKKKKSEPARKNAKDMSDDELVKAINRKRLEDTYNQLHPEKVSKGKALVKDFMDKSVTPALQETSRTLIKDLTLKLGKKYLGLNPEQGEDYLTVLGKEVKKMSLEKQYRKLKQEAEDEAARASKKPDDDTAHNNVKQSDNKQKGSRNDSDEPDVIIGEFVKGSGPKAKATAESKKTTYDIIDAEFEDVTPSSASNYPATQTGRTYIYGLLPPPKKKKDDD